MKTLKQIQNKAVRLAKKECAKNEIIETKVLGDEEFGMVFVKMQSTCDANSTMTWEFKYSYDAGNEEDFEPWMINDERYSKYVKKETFNFSQA